MPYGEKLAERLQATSASVIMTRVLRKAVIADQSHFPRAVGPASRLWRRHGDALAAAHFPVGGKGPVPQKRGSPMSVPGSKGKVGRNEQHVSLAI